MAGQTDSYANMSDEVLMQLSADGDQVAFGQIVSRYSGRILKLSIRITGAFEASEEISQEVLVKIWKNASAYSSSLSKFSTWMHKIIVNTCIDYMRRKKVEPLPEAFDVPDEGLSPEEAIERKEMEMLLTVALARIPVQQRVAINLVYGEERSGTETAALMGVSRKKVERLLKSARTLLETEISEMKMKWTRRSS